MDEREPTPEGDAPDGELELARLLAAAGPRPAVPADDLAAIAAAAHLAWKEKVASGRERVGPQPVPRDGTHPPTVARARPRWRVTRVQGVTRVWGVTRAWGATRAWGVTRVQAGALAATLALTGMGVWWLARSASAPVVAVVEALGGPLAVARDDGWSDAAPGGELVAGSRLRTASGAGATLRLVSGVALRLGAGSELQLSGGDAVALATGSVLVDTGAPTSPSGEPALTVSTPFGVVRDVGTVFSVHLSGTAQAPMRVQVRSGVVSVTWGARSWTAAAGEQLTVRRDGSVARGVFAPGEGWDLSGVDEPFLRDGRTVGELLDWVARETGWQVRYADPELAAVAARSVLHGELSGLSPQQAAFALLPGAGLEAELSGNVLTVRRHGGG